MTEEEARGWLGAHCDVPRETWSALDRYIALLRQAAGQQNLIARSTIDSIWSRHIVDSAQLLRLAPVEPQNWLDLGAGAGFPGLIVAALSTHPVTLVEERRKRVDFLREAIAVLGVGDRVSVLPSRVETAKTARFGVISARAFAPLDRLLPLAARFADETTIWVLPKGRSASSELEAARASWQGDFRIEPSVTDPEAAIIVASHVRPKGKR